MTWQVDDPRITPPHIADGPKVAEAPLWAPGVEADDIVTPEQAAQTLEPEDFDDEGANWLQMAKDAYSDSTDFLDTNYRKRWEDSLRMFRNEHPSDSKYNLENFRKRSHSFVPKTRAIIRKNEAAAAAAFFSNLDTVSIQAANEADNKQRASAAINQELMQYRLTHTIPWFLVVCGGLQDAQKQGACIFWPHWDFQAKNVLKPEVDRPRIDLVPLENIRFHAAADWMDPLNASPFLIHIMPMYIGDLKEKMSRPDPKGRVWREVSEATLLRYVNQEDDSTRSARQGIGTDPTRQRSRIHDYDIVWVHRHIHRNKSRDIEWYTLASEVMLSDPEPLERSVFHGKRPYVLGRCVLETHTALPSSVPELGKGLQEDLNDTRNQRNDNVKLALNKRFIVRRGKDVDMSSLVRNVPGGITLVNDIEQDVKEMSFQDVTQSAYLEEDRIVGNFDELTGNFNPMQVGSQRTPRESERTMLAVQAPSNLLTEYMLKTFVETGILPCLRQLLLLEQHYETDTKVLALCGEKAQLRQKFGMDPNTDDILMQELTTQVNVGMGATDPTAKLQRFLTGISAGAKIAQKPPAGIDLTEMWKEIFALTGYQDGTRFMDKGDPEKVKLQQQVQQLTMLLQKKVGDHSEETKRKAKRDQMDFAAKREGNLVKALLQDKEHRHDNVLKLADYLASAGRSQQGHGEAIQMQQLMQQPMQQRPQGEMLG